MNKVLFEQYPHFAKNHIHIPDGYSENLEAEAERYNKLLDERGPIDIQILELEKMVTLDLMNQEQTSIVKHMW